MAILFLEKYCQVGCRSGKRFIWKKHLVFEAESKIVWTGENTFEKCFPLNAESGKDIFSFQKRKIHAHQTAEMMLRIYLSYLEKGKNLPSTIPHFSGRFFFGTAEQMLPKWHCSSWKIKDSLKGFVILSPNPVAKFEIDMHWYRTCMKSVHWSQQLKYVRTELVLK